MKTSELNTIFQRYWKGIVAYRDCDGDEFGDSFEDNPDWSVDIKQIAFGLHKLGIDPMPIWALHAFIVDETFLKHDQESGRLVDDDLDRLRHLINRTLLAVRLLKYYNNVCSSNEGMLLQ